MLGWLGLCSLQCDLHSHPSQSCNAAATAQCLGGPPPCPLPRDAHTCPNTHRAQVRQEGNADDRQARHPRHLGPFPGGLQGEENKEWEGRTSLQNSLRSLLKVPSLPCLIFVTKLQVSTDSRLYLGIDKRIRRLGKACHQNSQDSNPKCTTLSSCWHPKIFPPRYIKLHAWLNRFQTGCQEIKVEGLQNNALQTRCRAGRTPEFLLPLLSKLHTTS